jgi:hypothetical protein
VVGWQLPGSAAGWPQPASSTWQQQQQQQQQQQEGSKVSRGQRAGSWLEVLRGGLF